MTTKKHKGSSFDSFLKEENLLEHTEAVAIKRVIAYQIEQEMKERHLTKTELANRLHTSRSALDRLLDPKNSAITLQTLAKVALILGKRLKISLA